MEIEYSKISALPDNDKFALEKIIESSSVKIERLLKEKCKLKVHIKESKKGKTNRYMINYMLETPKKLFTTKSKDTEVSADFDIVKAAHKEMEHLINEVKHHMKKEESNWKKYSPKKFFNEFKQ